MSAARDARATDVATILEYVYSENKTWPVIAEHFQAALSAAGYRIVGPGEVENLRKALSKAEDNAGTLPAREAVKLRPVDWHSLATAIQALGGKDA